MTLVIRARSDSTGNLEITGSRPIIIANNWFGWIPGKIPARKPNIIPKIVKIMTEINAIFYIK